LELKRQGSFISNPNPQPFFIPDQTPKFKKLFINLMEEPGRKQMETFKVTIDLADPLKQSISPTKAPKKSNLIAKNGHAKIANLHNQSFS
jgi:hypothetical protein